MKIVLILVGLFYMNLNASLIENTKEFFNNDKKVEVVDKTKIRKEKFNKKWEEVFPILKDGSDLEERLTLVPKEAWIKTDQSDIKDDIADIVNDIYSTLIDEDLIEYRETISEYENDIIKLKNTIQEYKEKQEIAKEEDKFYNTTKLEYEEKIEKKERKISDKNNKIKERKNYLINRLKEINIATNDEQLAIILESVDGDDLAKLYFHIDFMNNIIKRLKRLVEKNKEEIGITKKYYGMHLVTIQFARYTYNIYLEQLNIYVKNLTLLQNDTIKNRTNTETLMRKYTSKEAKDSLNNDLRNAKYTEEVINDYKKDLKNKETEIKNKIKEMDTTILLVRNKFRTVLISSQLVHLMKENISQFEKTISIQFPTLRNFENLELRKIHKNITKTIKNRNPQ